MTYCFISWTNNKQNKTIKCIPAVVSGKRIFHKRQINGRGYKGMIESMNENIKISFNVFY